jgi:hypothetical protein
MLQKVNENLKPTFIRMYASKIMSFPLRWNWKPQPHRIVTKEIRFTVVRGGKNGPVRCCAQSSSLSA